MSDRIIGEILENIPDTTDVTINYYVSPTINNYNYAGQIIDPVSRRMNAEINNTATNSHTQGSQTDALSVQSDTSSDQSYNTEEQPVINNGDIDITISTDNGGNISAFANINSSSNITNMMSNPPYTQINATIDYDSDIENINNVMNLTDALTESISNSLENIRYMNPPGISTEDMLEKTSLIIYKNIDNPDTKCHICNEDYNEFDICRKNNMCSHYFHHQCIDNWYSRNTKCPICQQVI